MFRIPEQYQQGLRSPFQPVSSLVSVLSTSVSPSGSCLVVEEFHHTDDEQEVGVNAGASSVTHATNTFHTSNSAVDVEAIPKEQSEINEAHHVVDLNSSTFVPTHSQEQATLQAGQGLLTPPALELEVVTGSSSCCICEEMFAVETEASIMARQLANHTNGAFSRVPHIPTLAEVVPQDGCGAVLGRPTIWCPSAYQQGQRNFIPWPSPQELEWEGDSRARSGFGRFLPLLRLRGNNTVAWYRLPRLVEHEFDQVLPVPTAEDLAWSSAGSDHMAGCLVDSDIWDAIDEAGST